MNYLNRDFSEPSKRAVLRPRSTPSSRKWSIPYRAIQPLAMAADAAIIFTTSITSGIIYHLEFKLHGNLQQFAGFAAVVAALFIAFVKSRDLYALPQLLNLKSQIRSVTVKWSLVFLFLTAVAFAMKVGESFSRGTTITFAISGLLALIGMRIVWRTYLADDLAVRSFSSRKIALLAEQTIPQDVDLFENLARHGLKPTLQFVLPGDQSGCKRVIAQAISAIRGSEVEEIVVSFNLDRWPKLEGLLRALRVLPLPVKLVPIGPTSELFKLSSHTIGDTVTIELQHGPRTWSQRLTKRTFDFVFAFISLISLLPLFLVAAIAIKLNSAGPIIFRQWRRGFNGRPFQIFKFRTMSVEEDGDCVIAARRNDSRVTRVGNWLRRTSIDELPQLLNVLQGTMSIVGPRPHALAHDNEFEKLLNNYAYRHHVKPGLTGWAQINGYRGEMRTVDDIEQRVKFDLWYIDNWSVAMDLKIIAATMTEVCDGKNAY